MKEFPTTLVRSIVSPNPPIWSFIEDFAPVAHNVIPRIPSDIYYNVDVDPEGKIVGIIEGKRVVMAENLESMEGYVSSNVRGALSRRHLAISADSRQ